MGMAQKMSKHEWQAFLSEGTRTGKLSTVRADGSPHIAPIWFLLVEDHLVFNTGENTVKGRNLVRDGRIALCVDDDSMNLRPTNAKIARPRQMSPRVIKGASRLLRLRPASAGSPCGAMRSLGGSWRASCASAAVTTSGSRSRPVLGWAA